MNPAEKSGRSFCSEVFFTRNEAKPNQGSSKNGSKHKLGDAKDIPLHQQKSWFANFQTLLFGHYEKVYKLGSSFVSFCFI
jgi:hypothetical protein